MFANAVGVGTKQLVIIATGNELLNGGTKPLSKPMLTDNKILSHSPRANVAGDAASIHDMGLKFLT